MKAKYYIGIVSAIVLAGMPVSAQYADYAYRGNDGASIIVNNYYNDYDYYYSSRINRFHRSYTEFDYYSPVFTETYWYTYNPYYRGISIYGGVPAISFRYNFQYPVYYGHNYYYDYGWYDPFYYSYSYPVYTPHFYANYYWGYSPYIYSYMYTPFVYNVHFSNRWAYTCRGWNWYCCGGNYYRPYEQTASSVTRRSSVGSPGSGRIPVNNIAVKSNPDDQIGNRRYTQSTAGNTNIASKAAAASSIGRQPSTGSAVNSRTEDRRAISQTGARSKAISQSAAVNELPGYRSQTRSMTAVSKPAGNNNNQSFDGRRSAASVSSAVQNRPVSSGSGVSSQSQRGSTMQQSRNSSQQESKSLTAATSVPDGNGRRR